MKSSRRFWIFSFLLISFFAIAVFYRLDRFTLWQDEAETALLAKSILQKGIPTAFFDGKWVTQFYTGQESNEEHRWHTTPWLPFYIAAASFRIFGFTDWAARFPFGVIGIFSALALLFLTLRWTKCKAMALLSLFFYVTNVTVLTYTRQCKYLPLYFLATILAVYGIVKWQQEKKGTLWTIFGFTLLFYCNHLAAGIAFAGFLFYSLLFREGRNSLPLLLKTMIGLAILYAPFFFMEPLEQRTAVHLSLFPDLPLYLKKLGTNLYYWNGQAFPLLFSLLFLWKRPPYFRFFGSIVLISWFLLPCFDKDALRYNLHLLPLFCIALGFLFVELWHYRKGAGLFLFGLFVFTNLFQNIPDAIAQKSLKPIFPKEEWVALKNYYFKEYQDPIKILPDLVAQHSKGTEYVFLNHDQQVWLWYSDIPMAYFTDAEYLPKKNPPIPSHYADRLAIDWWIGPHFVKMLYLHHIPEEAIIQEWKQFGYEIEIINTEIPILNWDLAAPIRYKHFLDKFSEKPSLSETIRLVHKLP